MNVKELIEKYEYLNHNYFRRVDTSEVLRDLKQLDEPQKVKIPQFVADFIAEQKKLGHTLSYSIDASMSDRVAEWYWDNSELFALAWIFGYEVEEEKRYRVVMPNVSSTGGVLTRIKHDDSWIWIDTLGTIVEGRTHTRKELEEAGFGWVFDCEGIEIEEVEG
nr:MAG TPA: Protein of unknown function (DUF1642) [Caudoviricetes sp.]